MKRIELEIEEQQLSDLKIQSSKISFTELRQKIARLEAKNALEECNKIAKEEGLDKMTDEDINNLIREAREDYDKNRS